MSNGDTCSSPTILPARTIREEIERSREDLQAALARLSKVEHTLPTRWLEMTRDQIHEKHGIWLHL